MGRTLECRFCAGRVRLVPMATPQGLRVLRVHVGRGRGARCRASRQVFGERLMDHRQRMLPGMEWGR